MFLHSCFNLEPRSQPPGEALPPALMPFLSLCPSLDHVRPLPHCRTDTRSAQGRSRRPPWPLQTTRDPLGHQQMGRRSPGLAPERQGPLPHQALRLAPGIPLWDRASLPLNQRDKPSQRAAGRRGQCTSKGTGVPKGGGSLCPREAEDLGLGELDGRIRPKGAGLGQALMSRKVPRVGELDAGCALRVCAVMQESTSLVPGGVGAHGLCMQAHCILCSSFF